MKFDNICEEIEKNSKASYKKVYIEFRLNTTPDEHFDPAQLKRGIEVEREHGNSEEICKSIAKDHLLEESHYYTILDKANL